MKLLLVCQDGLTHLATVLYGGSPYKLDLLSRDNLLSQPFALVTFMMSFYKKIRSEIQSKITGPLNIGHSDLQRVWGHWQCQTEQVSKVWCLCIWYRDTRQNHWTMKYRSQWPTKNEVIWCKTEQEPKVWCLSIRQSQRYKAKITGQWNIGHSDLHVVWGHWHCQTEQVSKVWSHSIR